jgi:hypothetical protein
MSKRKEAPAPRPGLAPFYLRPMAGPIGLSLTFLTGRSSRYPEVISIPAAKRISEIVNCSGPCPFRRVGIEPGAPSLVARGIAKLEVRGVLRAAPDLREVLAQKMA